MLVEMELFVVTGNRWELKFMHIYACPDETVWIFLGCFIFFFSGPFEEKEKTNLQSHFSAHTVWLFRCGTFGKHKPKVPRIHEQRTVWQSQMSKQSRCDLAIHYPVTSYCCCFEEERRRMASTEILDSIKKQHLLRKPHIQLLTSDI